jgi:Tol biopolymer transport system component
MHRRAIAASLRAIACVAAAAPACSSSTARSRAEPTTAAAPPPPVVARIVTTERGSRGGRLVFVDEAGQRVADLMPIADEPAVDINPAWSPDGAWIAFASSRGRASLAESSLWLVRVADRRARRLGTGPEVERDPRWTPDGRSLIYASSASGTFDLYRQRLAAGPDGPVPAGPPVRLTDGAGDELSPTVSPAGDAVVYMVLDRATGRSHLERAPLAGGAAVRLTEGPADLTPSFSPDGRTIVFAAAVKGRGDTDLHAIDADGGHRRLFLGEAHADETGPVFSSDGRFLFATAVYRSADGKPILSSLVALSLERGGPRRPIVLRALHDRSQVSPRFGVALAPAALDGALLDRNPVYLDAVRRAVVDYLNELADEPDRSRATPPPGNADRRQR